MSNRSDKSSKRDVIILGAGKGTRMGGELPKVLTEVAGSPMIVHVMREVEKAGFNPPVVVVGYKADMVKDSLPKHSRFALQTEQKGTGHAVKITQDMALQDDGSILILYGDQPLVKADTLLSIFDAHEKHEHPLTIATITVDSFDGWQSPFSTNGRIVRDADGKVLSIIEKKDATPEQLQIKEVNPAYFCVDASWLWKSLEKINTNNAQGEYYLTDIVGIAFQEGHPIMTVSIPPEEALGVNTPEQRDIAERMFGNK